MGADIGFSCLCGALKGVVHDVSPSHVSHLVCYCKDCQAAARHLGDGDALDRHGGTDLFQTVPGKIEITQGAEHLSCLRLSPKGLLRWHAGCCGSPLFTMLARNSVAFCGMNLARFEDDMTGAVGPVTGIYGASDAIDPPEGLKNKGILKATLMVIGRSIGSKLRREANPFLTDDGQPVVPPTILTLDQRRAAEAR